MIVLEQKKDYDGKNEQRIIRNADNSYSLQFRPIVGKLSDWTTYLRVHRFDVAEKHFLLDFEQKAERFGF